MTITQGELETGITNEERGRWVESELDSYRRKGHTGDDYDTAISDMIADLIHLANSKGEDAEAIKDRAWMNYEAEIEEVEEDGR